MIEPRPSAASWRAHVDTAIDPRFERAFAILDAVHAERQRTDERRVSRILALRGELAQLLAALDGRPTDRSPRETS
ncbi:hypothetical protein [Actinomycetospora aeridis]|uniref:Uncharacterized protein n=1 Tax=Actinomycetospora aeridis TaxID=3129231 RepID=A0ABU8N1Y6_9PSEU